MTSTTYKPLIIDNGGYTIKIGFAGDAEPLAIYRNVVTKRKNKIFIADQINKLPNYSALKLRQPIEKGYLVDCQTQATIWRQCFLQHGIKPKQHHLCLIQSSVGYPLVLLNDLAHMVFEVFKFPSLTIISHAYASLTGWSSQHPNSAIAKTASCVVVDCGYSETRITPIIQHQIQNDHVRRIKLAGKHMTNYLKELITYRYFDVSEESIVLDAIKEKLCEVALSFPIAMEDSKYRSTASLKHYSLPDHYTSKLGHVVDQPQRRNENEQILTLNRECFQIPEIVFTPSNVGVNQAGIGEVVGNIIEHLPVIFQQILPNQVIVVGGTTQFKGFDNRLAIEIQKFAPTLQSKGDNEMDDSEPESNILSLNISEKPDILAWQGASHFMTLPQAKNYRVHQSEYKESSDGLQLLVLRSQIL